MSEPENTADESLPEEDGKSAPDGQRGVPFQAGYDPRRGHGPSKGSGGRPTNAHIARMLGLALTEVPEEILRPLDPELVARLQREHPVVWTTIARLRLEAWREVTSRAFGRAGDDAEKADRDSDVEYTLEVRLPRPSQRSPLAAPEVRPDLTAEDRAEPEERGAREEPDA